MATAVDIFHRQNIDSLRPELTGYLEGARSPGFSNADAGGAGEWEPATAGGVARDLMTPGSLLHTFNTEVRGSFELAKLKAAVGDIDGARMYVDHGAKIMSDNRESFYGYMMEAHRSKDQRVRGVAQMIGDALFGNHLYEEVAVGVPDETTGRITMRNIPLGVLLDPRNNGMAKSFRERSLRQRGFGGATVSLASDPSEAWSSLLSVPGMKAANGEELSPQAAAEAVARSVQALGTDNPSDSVFVATRVLRETGSAALPGFLADVSDLAKARGISNADAADRLLSMHKAYYAQEAAAKSPDGRGYQAGQPDFTGYLTSSFRHTVKSLYGAANGLDDPDGVVRTAVGAAGRVARELRELGVLVPGPRDGGESAAFASDLIASVRSADGSVRNPRSKTFRIAETARTVARGVNAEPSVLDTEGTAALTRDGATPALAYEAALRGIGMSVTARLAEAIRDGHEPDASDSTLRDGIARDIRAALGLDESEGSEMLSGLLASHAVDSLSRGTALDLRGSLSMVAGETGATPDALAETLSRAGYALRADDQRVLEVAKAAGRAMASLDSKTLDASLARLISDTARDVCGSRSGMTAMFINAASDAVRALPPHLRTAAGVRRLLSSMAGSVAYGSQIEWKTVRPENGGRAMVVPAGVGGLSPEEAGRLASSNDPNDAVGKIAALIALGKIAEANKRTREAEAKALNAPMDKKAVKDAMSDDGF